MKQKNKALIVFFTMLFMVPLMLLQFGRTQDVQAVTNSQSEAIAKSILVELNDLRKQNDLGNVSGVSVLTNMSQNRANHLANINRLDEHSGYNYLSGAPFTAVAGENIGYWYNSSITDPKEIAQQIISNLYDDDGVATFGHRKNMLNPFFKHVGIGVSINPSNGYIYYAQDFGSTTAEVGNNFDAMKAYADYSNQVGLSAQYPSTYQPNAKTASVFELFSGATKISSAVTTSQLTSLYSAPVNGIKSNRALAPKTDWYTDQVYVDQSGNHWYRVSTSEWAMINNAKIRNVN